MKRIVISMTAVAAAVAALLIPAGSASAGTISAGSITCTINVQDAHGSTHVNGTINVVSTVSCTAPVAMLQQRTALYKVGGSSWWGSQEVTYDVRTVQSNSATPCSQAPGSFYGAAVTDVVWPLGYTGPTHASTYGKTYPIDKNCKKVTATATKTAASASDDVLLSYTVSATHDN